MSQLATLIVIAVVLGPLVLAGFWIAVLRAGMAPVRAELARLADATQMQNEISLDDELRPASR